APTTSKVALVTPAGTVHVCCAPVQLNEAVSALTGTAPATISAVAAAAADKTAAPRRQWSVSDRTCTESPPRTASLCIQFWMDEEPNTGHPGHRECVRGGVNGISAFPFARRPRRFVRAHRSRSTARCPRREAADMDEEPRICR